MEHYYSEKQSSALKPEKKTINVNNDSFELYTASGLFSKEHIDSASKLLIEHASLPEQGKVLDLGCGYGVIGISLLKKNPDLKIFFSDVNERALLLTKKNLELHGLKGKVIKSFLFENIKEEFSVILSNPPMSAGKDVCFRLIEEAYEYLEKNGSLQLVARHNKGGKALKEKILEVFGNAEELARQGGFRVYKGEK